MRPLAECGQADVLEKIDGGRNGEIGGWVARSGPQELFVPTLRSRGGKYAPAEIWGLDQRMIRRCDVQEPGTKRGGQPFVAAGRVKRTIETVERKITLGNRVRPVDADGYATL